MALTSLFNKYKKALTRATCGALLAALVAVPVVSTQATDCINCATIPQPATGHSEVRLRPTNTPPKPAGDGVGSVRTVCTPSHYLYDDPILLPNEPGKWWHLHLFWGNTAANAWTTPESLLSVGNSTCRGGIINRSAYWMPAIIDTSDGAVIQPDRIHVYYKTGYHIGTVSNRGNEKIIPPPAGLRVATKPGKTKFEIRCGAYRGQTFTDCGLDSTVDIMIDIPQCWDGVNLNSPDQSHLVYAKSGCPSTHPLPIPQITFVVNATIPAGRNTANWVVSSDMGKPGGSTIHADWMNGWIQGREVIWTRDIINKGLNGGSHHAGNGEEWF